MFRLWFLAELDLLSPNCRYRLCDTGQGLHRVQAAPQVAKAMAQILTRCQQQIGTWVGSSVVHLGDTNVPNALMFIDKYTQVRFTVFPLWRFILCAAWSCYSVPCLFDFWFLGSLVKEL